MEIIELANHLHPYFVGAQFHPEYKTRPLKPSPLFLGFVLAATGLLDVWKAQQHLPSSPESTPSCVNPSSSSNEKHVNLEKETLENTMNALSLGKYVSDLDLPNLSTLSTNGNVEK
ncbi:CTP synthase 2 [Coelomomyces lativittatus]|nr:CTP synthase 2 [Coelomomyces lativittatus]